MFFPEKQDMGTVWAVKSAAGSTELETEKRQVLGSSEVWKGSRMWLRHFSVILLCLTSLPSFPPPSSSLLPPRLCLSSPWRRPTVFVCLFLTLLSLPANPPALTCNPLLSLLPRIFLSAAVSLSSISWSCRSAQVETRVVLSLSSFTHSRYYHQAPVSLADSHLDRAVNHLADNDEWCPLCQAWCPQMKGLRQAWP